MFMTWFVVSSRTEFEIKSDHFGGRENNLWQKLANFFFSPLLGIHLALATGFHGSPIVWRKGSGVDDVSRSRDAEGWWIPPTLPSPRLPSPLIRGVENLGAGRIEHSGLQAELPPLYETRGGRGRSGTNARARATTRRTHARTQPRNGWLFTPIKGYQERIGKQESSKKHGEMRSIKRAENYIGARIRNEVATCAL